jgi:ADP-ribose pyrophosphatase
MSEKIPSQAKKVFSWVRFEIFQWEQELYDGTTTTFERARFRDGAFVIPILPDGQILLTKQEQPARNGAFFTLPWGSFDTNDEDPLVCAKRELFEETGYESDEWELFKKEEGTSNVIVDTYFYIARNCQKRRTHINPDHGEKVWLYPVSFEAFLDIALEEKFIHWNLVPILCRAKIDEKYRGVLFNKFFG